MTRPRVLLMAAILASAASYGSAQQAGRLTSGASMIEHDADVATNEPGTHNGGGMTIGYSFFKNAPGLKLVFRKRALKPGSGIGYHEQKEDEIYYVLSGKGVMTLDGKTVRRRSRRRDPDAAGQLARPEAGRD